MSDVQRRRHEITLRELSLKLQAMRRAQEFDARLKRDGRKAHYVRSKHAPSSAARLPTKGERTIIPMDENEPQKRFLKS